MRAAAGGGGMSLYHYYAELALWIAALFLAGCPVGALARKLWDGWRGRA